MLAHNVPNLFVEYCLIALLLETQGARLLSSAIQGTIVFTGWQKSMSPWSRKGCRYSIRHVKAMEVEFGVPRQAHLYSTCTAESTGLLECTGTLESGLTLTFPYSISYQPNLGWWSGFTCLVVFPRGIIYALLSPPRNNLDSGQSVLHACHI